MSSLDETEKLGSAGATHPRITLDYMKSQIATIYYIDGKKLARHADFIDVKDKVVSPKLEIFTVCMMVLKNDFIVLGKSAPLSPENYDVGKGRTFAYEECIRQLWPLFAFAHLSRP